MESPSFQQPTHVTCRISATTTIRRAFHALFHAGSGVNIRDRQNLSRIAIVGNGGDGGERRVA